MSIDPKVVKTAVDSMLRVHAETGHDLTAWPEVLPLVVAVYPDIRLEGTGPTGEHTQHSGAGETGRYWIHGVQNTNAYIDSDSEWAKAAKRRIDEAKE